MTDPTHVPMEPLDEAIIHAVTACGHSIDSNRIVLHFDAKKPGHNALNQLHRRILAAIALDRAARAQGDVGRLGKGMPLDLNLRALANQPKESIDAFGVEWAGWCAASALDAISATPQAAAEATQQGAEPM